MLELRDYQIDLRDRAREAIARGVRRILIQAPTGSGKTCLVAAMLKGAVERKKRAWFCCHRGELLVQSVETFIEAADIHTGIIAAGYPMSPLAPVQVCSVQSLKRRAEKLAPPDLIVWDECFVAGTMIGDTPIEQIKTSDRVQTWDEERQRFDFRIVLGAHKQTAPHALYEIQTGRTLIICTARHPLLTDVGWRIAAHLQVGDSLHGLRVVRRHDEEKRPTLSGVLSALDVRTQSAGRAGAYATSESDAPREYSQQDERDTETNRPQAGFSWWEWLRLVGSGGIARLRAWLANRNAKEARGGSEKGDVPFFRRVDRIEILEQGSDGRFEQVCRDGFVYNFETEGTHTYIANGLTVHNCHHTASKSWSAIAALFPRAVHIGLSATPQRTDGQGLAPYFDELICGPSTAELIAAGWLSPYTLYAPPNALDLSKVKRVAGDYNKHEVAEAMEPSTVVGDAVSHYRQHCPDARALVFAWSLDASRRITEQFIAAGVPAAHIDGETPAYERRESMRAFRDGSIRVLCNVDLFGEGLDVPAVDAVFLLRPTQSLGLHLQQIGRGLRPSPGKAAVKIFDHVNNWERHGLPDDPREWSLEGREKKSRESVAMGRRCEQCFGVSPIGATACRYCGHAFPAQSRSVEQVDGTLQAADVEALRAHRAKWMAEIKNCRTQRDYARVGRMLGYRPGWAYHMSYRKIAQEVELAHRAAAE